MKTEDMHFYPGNTGTAHRWPDTDIEHSAIRFLPHPHFHGIHPGGRQLFPDVFQLYIGSREAQRAADFITLRHLAGQGIGIAQEFVCTGNIPSLQGIPDFC